MRLNLEQLQKELSKNSLMPAVIICQIRCLEDEAELGAAAEGIT
jgi:hypothetical protein